MSKKAQMSKYLAAIGLSAAAAISGGYLIIPFEGEVLSKNSTSDNKLHLVYKDPIGIPTYCWGLTGKDMYGKLPVVGRTYTEKECMEMFVPRLKQFEKAVDARVKVPYSSPYQKAALISFTYNVGEGSLQTSTLLKKLNSKDYKSACEQLTRWVYAQKKKLGGLVTRRDVEMQWCLGEVPYEVEVTYNEIVDMARLTSESNTIRIEGKKEEKK